jgi:3-hydroxybutyryl-CoA dehydrogenase
VTEPAPVVRPEIRKVGIVGAGQMGIGIAHVCATHGVPVVLMDMKPEARDRALAAIAHNMDRQIAKGTLTAEAKQAALANIRITGDHAAFADCDLMLEAATEREDAKRAIYQAIEPHLRPDCIMASNTSSISITRLAASTGRPDRFIGIHFMNPAPIMKLVELIRGIATAESTYQAARGLAEHLGKATAMSEDFPAFIVNRILVPMINEAVYALYEGVGSVAAIDGAMKMGANHPMGPLELADFIGLDTCLAIMQVLHEGLADSKYRPCPLLVKYVEAGWLGRKAKRGFYDYTVTPPRPTR